jgi:hypothetical protein
MIFVSIDSERMIFVKMFKTNAFGIESAVIEETFVIREG